MRKADKREFMLEWFHDNFEDPAENTSYSSEDGGYQWNFGGPHDATEELYEKFDGIASQALIEDVIAKVQQNGVLEWAPAGASDDYRTEPSPDQLIFDFYEDEPTERYGSQEDHAARDNVRMTLQALLDAIDQPRPVGIGHNNPPPDEVAQNEIVESIKPEVLAIQEEFQKTAPSIPAVKKLTGSLRTAALETGKWIGRKLDKTVDLALGVAIGATASHTDQLFRLLDALINWLNIVALK
jgi:hypothetical protein